MSVVRTVKTEIFPEAELRFVRTVGEALRALDVGDYALVIIGMHFEDSKMFELLWHIKAKRLGVPASVAGVATAARALGACDFIDLCAADAAALRERFVGFFLSQQHVGTSLA